jgi:Ca-activated chloride channel family protein
MRWGDPRYFLLLLLIPFWVGLFIYLTKRRRQILARFCDEKFVEKLIPYLSRVRRIIKQVFWVLAFVFLSVALAEPQWGYHFEEVVRKGVDLMLVVDVSNSMLAEDVKPNRLERAKRKVYDLLKVAHGDRIGLIVFAGRSILLCPQTLDYQAIYQFLETLSTDLIPVQGTDLAGALKLAMKSFKDPKTSKAIMVFTDGEDFSSDLQTVAGELKQQKIPLYILGFGTPEGAPIPLPRGEGGFKRDEAGNVVITKLAERSMADLAVASGGEYVRSVTGDEDLNELYVKGLKSALSGSEIKASKKRVYESRFQWPLALGLIFLVVEMLIGENRRRTVSLS